MRISAQAIWNGHGTARPGRISIRDGRIEQILPPGPADIDLGEAILCAGFVNAHLHLDLSLPRPTETMVGPFEEWLRSVVAARQQLGEDGLTIQAAFRCRRNPRRWHHRHLRHRSCRSFDHGADRQPAETIAAARGDLGPLTTGKSISKPSRSFSARRRRCVKRELRGISPHSSYTVHPELLATLLPWCREQDVPWAMHIAEPTWERELLVDGSGEGARFLEGFGADPASFRRGQTMIEALHGSGDLTRHGLVVHGNECSEDEISAIGESASALVWCPRSHAFFGRTPHPAPDAARSGVPVMLGTDGKVSAGTLSMLDEMGAARAAAADLDIETIWKMAIVHPRQWLARSGPSGTARERHPERGRSRRPGGGVDSRRRWSVAGAGAGSGEVLGNLDRRASVTARRCSNDAQ